MVQIFDMTPTPSSASMIGSALGQGLTKRLGLSEAETAAQQAGNDPVKLAFALARANMAAPGLERSLGQIYEQLLKRQQAQAAQNVPFGLENQIDRTAEGRQHFVNENRFQREELPGFGSSFQNQQGQSEFFPSIQPGQEYPGNVPQAATSGVKQRVPSNAEMIRNSKPLAKEMSAAGIPTTPQQAYEIQKQQRQDIIDSNALVEEERKERVAQQRDYGKLGEKAITQVMPDATPEQVAMFKRKGEEFAGKNQSEANIERKLAGEARKLKNVIASIKKSIPKPRALTGPLQSVTGVRRQEGKQIEDIRQKIKPLLDDDLYDTARNLLSEVGYYPEEREEIVSRLSEGSNKTIAEMPKIGEIKQPTAEEIFTGKAVQQQERYTPQTENIFKQNLAKTLSADPTANLILLRKKYEEKKGVDWELFKNGLNELMDSGQFKPTDDQLNQLDKLDQPPLDVLDTILYKLNLKGR